MTHDCFEKCPCTKMIEYDKEENAYYIVDEDWTRLQQLLNCPYCAEDIDPSPKQPVDLKELEPEMTNLVCPTCNHIIGDRDFIDTYWHADLYCPKCHTHIIERRIYHD